MCGALVIDSMPPATTVPNSPAADQLVGQRDRMQPRQAHLVDRDGGHVHRHAAGDRRLPRGDLAAARLQHLTHDHVVDLLGREAGPLDRAANRDPAELRRRNRRQTTVESTHRGACPGHENRRNHANKLMPEVNGR